MRYLLDTHVFLWACIEPERLSSNSKDIIKNPQNMLFLSSASIWEISIKMKIGKLKILDKNLDFKTFVEKSIKALDLKEISVLNKHIFSLHLLPDIHKDPFDRILIAQAKSEDLILITNDNQIKKYNIRTLW